MKRPTTQRGRLLAAIATLVVSCSAIVLLAVLLSDHTTPVIFLPLFSPAVLTSWVVYRSGDDNDPAT